MRPILGISGHSNKSRQLGCANNALARSVLFVAVFLVYTSSIVHADTTIGPGAASNPSPEKREASHMDEPFASRLTTSIISDLFPNSDSVPKIEGNPPVATVTQEGKAIGYLFSTHETVHPTGYAGHSFDIVVALDVNGVIRGHRTLEHHEPLIGRHKLSDEHLDRFLSQLHGINLKTAHRFRPTNYDGVSRATVSAEAMRRATTAAAITVGELKGLISADQSGSMA